MSLPAYHPSAVVESSSRDLLCGVKYRMWSLTSQIDQLGERDDDHADVEADHVDEE